MKFAKILTAFLAVSALGTGHVQADKKFDWSNSNEAEAYWVGKEIARQSNNEAAIYGIGGCAVAVVGMIGTGAGVFACVFNFATEAMCVGSGALAWFTASFMTMVSVAGKQCDNIGQNFNGNTKALRCFAAGYIMNNPPPGGVPRDVYAYYSSRCEVRCDNPKKCVTREAPQLEAPKAA
ncbi:hypothetical protein BGZ51_006195 [Haplosporangium sp. Z 767]|nr:hypothetical protein BGZ50_006256 [Haplosporangium sp. Z 11]KAF9180458.1 hypothetical protein BGZ51_006195 [Haplosporangium sp. Z 767]